MYIKSSTRALSFNDIAIPAICILLLLALVIFPKISIDAAIKGLNLSLNVILPSLFPFFVLSDLLNSNGFVKASGKLLEPVMRPLFNVPGCGSFALLMGITSGYPVGAAITCSLLENKSITKNEAERLLAFTNNSGPLFIIGAVATGMYGMPALGIFLLACHISACLSVGVIFRFYGYRILTHNINENIPDYIKDEKRRKSFEISNKKQLNISNRILAALFAEAIKKSIYQIINIGAFIIFFSVIINLLLDTGIIVFISNAFSEVLSVIGINSNILSVLLSGFFEITTGTNLASKLSTTPISIKLVLTSVIIGWAGLSVHSQVYSIAGNKGISLKPYVLGKLLQGIIAGLFTFIGLQLSFIKKIFIHPVLNTGNKTSLVQWQETLLTSCTYLLFVLLIYAMFCFASYIVKRFFKK